MSEHVETHEVLNFALVGQVVLDTNNDGYTWFLHRWAMPNPVLFLWFFGAWTRQNLI